MTIKGPAPTPTALRILKGDRKDRINRCEPTPPSGGAIEAPEYLVGAALGVWRRLAPSLIEAKLLTPWDIEAFAIYCDSSVRYHEAAKLLDREGFTVPGATGGTVRNPTQVVVSDLAKMVRAFATEFGLTPSARSRLKAETPDADSADDLLTG